MPKSLKVLSKENDYIERISMGRYNNVTIHT